VWLDPEFPTFGGDKEVTLFGEELRGSKHQFRLGKCYYFNAGELVARKRLWTERKRQRKQKRSKKGKEPEVARPL
jgi:hypothetical protein